MSNFTITRTVTTEGNLHQLVNANGQVVATHNSSTQFGGVGANKVCLVSKHENYVNGVTPTGTFRTEFNWAISADRLKKTLNYKWAKENNTEMVIVE